MTSRGHDPTPLGRVLVPGDDFHSTLAFVRALRAGGYLPVLAVDRPGTYASRSRAVSEIIAVPDAAQAPEAFSHAIAQAADTLGVDAVLPGTEASLIALTRWPKPFPCPLGAPDRDIVDRATNKARLLQLSAAVGLGAPLSVIGTPAALGRRADAVSYPAIVKPASSWSEIGDDRLVCFKARRVESAQEVRSLVVRLPDADWLLQPFLAGPLSAIAGVAWEGRMVGAVHQVSHRTWPPHVGYSAYAETVAPDLRTESRVSELLKRIGWSGLFQVQLLDPGDGRRLVIDFNPRPYGSLSLAVRAGANLAAVWASLVLGSSPPPVRYRAGVRYRLEHNDLRAIIWALRNGDIVGGLTGLTPHARTVHGVFSLRDPKPALTWAGKLLARGRR